MKKIRNMLIAFLCVLSMGLGAAFAGCDSLLGGIIPQPPVESSSSQSSDEGIPPEHDCANGKHAMMPVDKVIPNCVTKGCDYYEVCTICNFGYETRPILPIDPNNHLNPIKLDNGQFYCDACNKTWGEAMEEGCESGKHKVVAHGAIRSTCVLQGWSEYESCALCGFGEDDKKALPLDPDNHPNPTKLDNGQFHCNDCNKTWGEAEGHTHAWDDGVEIVSPTCGQEGLMEYSCACGSSYTMAIPATGMHQTERLFGKAATCQETGLTEGSWCPVCQTVFEEQKEIPTVPHTEEVLFGYEAGCESEGLSDGVWCTTCKTTLKKQEPLSPLGHNEVEISPAIKGDCITEGRTAEIYCNRCEQTVQYSESTGFGDHIWMTYPGQPADCWNEGWTDYEACALCKYGEMENRKPIPPQHNLQWHEGRQPTCYEEGWEGYYACDVCGYGKENLILLPAQHAMEWVPPQQATCMQEGWDGYDKCTICGYEENKIVYGYDYSNHVNVWEENGYYYCVCGMSWGDGSGGGDIGGGETGGCESGNHSWEWVPYREATCYEQGWYPYEKCSICGLVNGEIYYMEAGHQLEYISAQEPTCEAIGWYEYERCMRCGHTTYQEIPQLEHKEVYEKGEEPTCNKPGSTGCVSCEYCGKILKEAEEIPATGEHVPYEKESGREPTCDGWGWTAEIYCSTCGTKLQEMVDIAPLPHTPVFVPEQMATCTQKGTTAYEYCEVCKNVIGEEPKETDYTFHNFPAWGEACLDCGAKYYSQGLEYFEEWYVDKIGEYYVWGLGTCTDTDLVIPDELHGVPVTEITLYSDDFVSVGAENITSLSFGSNITLVTGASFESCTNLTNVYYRGSLSEWVSAHIAGALHHNVIRTIYIDGKPVTGDIVIPDDVTSISSYAFIHQPITSVTMGDQVESLGMMAFYNCKNLVTARLSANIKVID
ncbi:MAG: leucine-rich repeat protein, partial [Clostridia bacterium]|nr:leucine-rich repeat protein [Clostridia bacterium]